MDGEKTFGWKLGWNRFRLNAVEIGWNVVGEPPDETGSTLEQSWMESGWKPGMETLDGNLGWKRFHFGCKNNKLLDVIGSKPVPFWMEPV